MHQLLTPIIVDGFQLNHNQAIATPIILDSFRLNHNQATRIR